MVVSSTCGAIAVIEWLSQQAETEQAAVAVAALEEKGKATAATPATVWP